MAKDMTADEKAAQQARLLAGRRMVDAASKAMDEGLSGEEAMERVERAVGGDRN